MLTTTEQESVADVNKLPPTRNAVTSYSWSSETLRAKVMPQKPETPVEGNHHISSTEVYGASAVRVPTPAMDVSSRFGLRLRELRRERNLTQLRMAREFGI